MSALKPVSADQSVSLIFLDPPYGQNLLMPAVHALQGAGWADADTLFVCEVERNCREIPIRPLVDKAYGDSRLIIGQI